MGITEEKLKLVQKQRENSPLFSKSKFSGFYIILLIAFVLINIIFNIVKINELKQARNSDERAIAELSAVVKQKSEEISQVKQEISKLEAGLEGIKDTQNAQSFALENLKKAKDNILTRVSNLEAKEQNQE